MKPSIKTKIKNALSRNNSPDSYFLLYGFIFMGLITSMVQCSGPDDDPLFDAIDQELQEQKIDYEGIKQTGNTIEELFNENDFEGLIELKFDDAGHEDFNHQYSNDELNSIGKAFAKRKLTTVTGSFAEFTYTIEGVDYTLTMGVDQEGNWRIIRF